MVPGMFLGLLKGFDVVYSPVNQIPYNVTELSLSQIFLIYISVRTLCRMVPNLESTKVYLQSKFSLFKMY